MQNKKEIPYLFKLNKDKQFLYYFGAEHSNDFQHRQFNLLEDFFKEFVKYNNREKVVFIEGNEIPIKALSESRDENIKKLGERGLLLDLTLKNKISYVYGELYFQEEADILNKDFSQENIIYFYVTRLICGLLRKNPIRDFEEVLEMAIADWSHNLNWDKELFTIKKIKGIHKRLFKEEMSSDSIELIKKVCIPINEEFSIINRIAKVSSQTRDKAVLQKIKEKWKEKKSIFIVYGHNHSLKQELYLREMCK